MESVLGFECSPLCAIPSRSNCDARHALDLVQRHVTWKGCVMPIEMDERVGQPSRWNTLGALRVLNGYYTTL